jgi:IclR family acetate operon transcriptional repressor
MARAQRARAESGGVQAVERAIDVLSALAEAGARPTLQQLAERLGVAPSTIHRIVTTLERTGMVERDAVGGGYAPGPKIAALYNAHAWDLDVRARAQPLMEQLRDATQETVSLHVRRHTVHVCVESLDSPHELRIRLEVGATVPLCHACTGRAILAHLPPSEARRILSEECAPIGAVPGGFVPGGFAAGSPTAGSPTAGSPDRDGWVGERLYELQMVRAAGYATGLNEPSPGMAGVSAPVFGRGAEVLGALTVSGPTVRFRRREILAAAEQLRAAAATLSSQLGHRLPVALMPRRGLERRVSGRVPTP